MRILKNIFTQGALLLFIVSVEAQPFIIQESGQGFCAVDGIIATSVTGYTGAGYADSDRGPGKSVSWSVEAENPVTCRIKWRYANGGGSGDRLADLLINLETIAEDVNFVHTGEWTNWVLSDSVTAELKEGYNNLRLVSQSEDGLANIDYIEISGTGISAVECLPQYTLQLMSNNPLAGNVSMEPVLTYYDEGTEVTMTAGANPGFFFHSWSGTNSSIDNPFTFQITGNVEAEALFYPVGTVMDTSIVGYATVQDDQGTPYLLTGGAYGETVEAATRAELESYLESVGPLTVTVSGKIEGEGEVAIASDKTLLGITDSAHIKGIKLEINSARNIIIRNIKLSHVVQYDEIEITGKSKNIWIDHCELFTDRDHDIDYYDGLLDIKNEASFITISWNEFHDHHKTSLISSGDQCTFDTVIRVTYHHNYFHDCGSRLPSIRFGKAHIFNNYYLNCNDAISTRMGACVRVENNYFENIGKAVFNDQSAEIGYVHLLENHFGQASYVTSPTCELLVPYDYVQALTPTEDVPEVVLAETEPPVAPGPITYETGQVLDLFPNPAQNILFYRVCPEVQGNLRLRIINLSGQLVMERELSPDMPAGEVNLADLPDGSYIVQVVNNARSVFRRIQIIR